MVKSKEIEKLHDQIAIGEEESEKKAASMVAEKAKEEDKREKEAEAAAKEILAGEKRVFNYKLKIAEKLASLLGDIDWPPGYSYDVEANDEGVALMFRTSTGGFYARGMRVTGDIEYDLNGVHVMKARAENTVDRLTGADADSRMMQTKSGIYLPTQHE